MGVPYLSELVGVLHFSELVGVLHFSELVGVPYFFLNLWVSLIFLLEAECQAMAGTGFMDATPEQRLALLERIDREQKDYMDSKADDAPAH